MNRQFYAQWLSRLTIVLSVWLAFVVRGNTQEGGGPGIFGGRTPMDLLDKHRVPGGLGSYGFGSGVGGIAFGAIAEASRSGLFLVALEYHPELDDGSRLLAVVEDAGIQRIVTIDAPDWLLIPTAQYAHSGQHAAMTLFGKMVDPSDERWMHDHGYDIINFERALKNTLLGLRLFQADVLILSSASADLPRTTQGYVLGLDESIPDVTANQQALTALYTSIESYGAQPFQSYIITDRGTGVTFDVSATHLTLKGSPYWYCWREVPMTVEARNALWQEAQDYANAQLKAEKEAAWIELGPDAYLALYTDDYQQERFDEIFDAYISPRLMQGLPEISDRISTEVAALGGINPAVYAALSRTMQLAALYRLAVVNAPTRFEHFIQAVREVIPKPCLQTPSGYKPNTELVLPGNLLTCPTPLVDGTSGAGGVAGNADAPGTLAGGTAASNIGGSAVNPGSTASVGTGGSNGIGAVGTSQFGGSSSASDHAVFNGGTGIASPVEGVPNASGGVGVAVSGAASASGGVGVAVSGAANASGGVGVAVSGAANAGLGVATTLPSANSGSAVAYTTADRDPGPVPNEGGASSYSNIIASAAAGVRAQQVDSPRTPSSPNTAPTKQIGPASNGSAGASSRSAAALTTDPTSSGCDCSTTAGADAKTRPSAALLWLLLCIRAVRQSSRHRSRK